MNSTMDAKRTVGPPGWIERHLPTCLRAHRKVAQMVARIPLLPPPLAHFLLVFLGIITLIAGLLIIGTALSITVRP